MTADKEERIPSFSAWFFRRSATVRKKLDADRKSPPITKEDMRFMRAMITLHRLYRRESSILKPMKR
jgi:ribosomal protein S19E (S16A)